MSVKAEILKVTPQPVLDAWRKKKYHRQEALAPDKYPVELARWFKKATGEDLDLENPVTFNQKIQWLKLYDSTPEKGRLADKYLVREYVAERIGERYLVPLLGAWDDPDDIDFDALPDRFVLKATHGCGWNIIVRDKSQLDIPATRKKLRKWLDTDWAYVGGLELHYHYCEPRIVAEQFLENTVGGGSDLYDYKFWCFGGRCEYVMFLEGRAQGLHMSFYDRDWKLQDFVYSFPRVDRPVPRPSNLDEMIGLAERLADGLSHARVDLYRLDDGTLYFGEMTFTSCSGGCKWEPTEANHQMGQLLKLPHARQEFVK